ncbi:MAG: hypothetical protein JRG87_12725 [Deltaproteobacteria bacterium]|nr:hypothetical protein [Deltaproteobacteria bacterium]MBW1970047.1 hypothetical protein [Deltaproteobacteria bacterium]MBW2157493.1 hypothetical protein [Deltaproteobacteria bacterium]MBW2227850.1 hypothetical protein [Deltaproteobacteria bacterium]
MSIHKRPIHANKSRGIEAEIVEAGTPSLYYGEGKITYGEGGVSSRISFLTTMIC